MNKKCNRCGEMKSIEQFHLQFRDKGQYMPWCKACERERYRSNRLRLKEKFREKARRYYQKNKERIKATRKANYTRDKYKISARYKVREALYKGIIERGVCEVCGDVKVEAHHDDYSKPLEVRWLCKMHHQRFHSPYPV